MSGTKQLSFKLVPGENATEQLDAQAHIWNHIFNFVNSMSLKCEIELALDEDDELPVFYLKTRDECLH
nr:trans-resveratrol di-o-methyltransferase [Quercus suber]